MRTEDPYIIVDAWNWNGFAIGKVDSNTLRSGLMGVSIRIKGKGELEVDTSWGIERFTEGDKLVVVDVASIVSHLKELGKKHVNDCLRPLICSDLISLVLLHELSHWGEEFHRSDRTHSKKWDNFFLKEVYPYTSLFALRTKE
jgi:hypothetical protein